MSLVLDRDGLQAIVADLAGLSLNAIVYGEVDPNPIIGRGDRARVSLDLSDFAGHGVDEHRQQLSDGTDGYPEGTFWIRELGERLLKITFKAEAFDKHLEAAEIIDRIRTGMQQYGMADRLNAIGLAFVWAGSAVRVPLRINERVVNCAMAEFEFAGVADKVSLVIPPDVGGDYIETINGDDVPIAEISE